MFNYKIITRVEDLPRLPKKIKTLYLDVETTTDDKSRGAFLPYKGDRVCGVAFSFDDCEQYWYLVMRHNPVQELFDESYSNLPLHLAVGFLQELLDISDDWVNHNVKFDAHFLAVEGIQITTRLIDTLTLAKLVDMQSRDYGYGLKQLAERWCGDKASEQDEVKSELRRRKTKDYGEVPANIMGKYACADIRMNKKLWKEILRRRYDGIARVWNIELNLTSTLFQIERRGLTVDTEALRLSNEASNSQIARIESEIDALGLGEVNLASSSALAGFVVTQLKLPIICTTSSGRASVNAEALQGYRELNEVKCDSKLKRFFELLAFHRERSQFIALYADGWSLYINEHERMHPMYRQTVATGRMACANPNMQQLNKEAKSFVVPQIGNAFLSLDYSQIEYRVIASLTRDERIFGAYRKDPATDFHTYIADLCGIERRPAKTVNFGIAFGMGERKLVQALSESLGGELAQSKASKILHTYHQKFPSIRKVSDLATRRAKSRGWIQSLYGRRRALTGNFTHKAFNTAVQGTAADIAKERLIAVNKDELLLNAGVTVRAVVHDEFMFEGCQEAINCPEIVERVSEIMTNPTIDLGVPLLVDSGISAVSWANC